MGVLQDLLISVGVSMALVVLCLATSTLDCTNVAEVPRELQRLLYVVTYSESQLLVDALGPRHFHHTLGADPKIFTNPQM